MPIEAKQIELFKSVLKFVDPQISDEATQYMVDCLIRRDLKKKDHYIEVEKIHREIGFVASGLVRGYYVNEKGEDITTRIIDKQGFVTNYSAFLNQTKSSYYFQCLEDTTLLCFNYQQIQEGYQKHPELERFGRLIGESIIQILESRTQGFHFLSATERYLDFVERFPNLVNRISLNHISSYIGIARPSLSRIRKQISKQKRM